MKSLNQIYLSTNQQEALIELKQRLNKSYEIEEMIIYGSVARGEADEESDLDILLVTRKPMNRITRHLITDIACEINLIYDSNISTLVVDKNSWESGLYSVLPIHYEIINEGVLV